MAFILLLLISATWLLGLMAVNGDVMTFHYLFAVFSCLQVATCSPHSPAPANVSISPAAFLVTCG